MKRVLDWSDWCSHSAQSWTMKRCGVPWCDDCGNYVDGWRRAIRQPLWRLLFAWFAASIASWVVSS